MNQNSIPCSSCRKPKHELKARKSKLIGSQTLYLCGECITEKYEPRWVIIMAGRQFGPDYVKDYLKPKRYVGSDILLSEVIASL